MPTSTADPDLQLVYRGLGFCDVCGAELTPKERMAGLCGDCRTHLKRPVRSREPGLHKAKDRH